MPSGCLIDVLLLSKFFTKAGSYQLTAGTDSITPKKSEAVQMMKIKYIKTTNTINKLNKQLSQWLVCQVFVSK